MKIIVVAVTILIVLTAAPASASFFDEFHGAISSVHESFGRLFTDVVSDVSETIGCTVLAVKQVLALDGSYHESSDYNTRCKGHIAAIKEHTKGQHYNLNERDAVGEIESIEAQLKRQTDRLWEISDLLRREIDNIPSDIKIKFGVREPDPSESVVGRIWSDLKLLHDIEHSNEKNNPQVTEIHNVLDKALSIMRMNSTNSNESDDDKIKSLFRGIEKESNDTTIKIEEQFTKWEKQESMEKQRTNDSLIKPGDDKLRIKNDVKEIIKDLKEDGIGSSEVQSLITTVNEINDVISESNTGVSVHSAVYENNDSPEMTDEPGVESITTTSVAPTTVNEINDDITESNTDASVYSADCGNNNVSEMTDEPSVESITTTTAAPTTNVTPATATVVPSTSTTVSTTTTTTAAPTTSVTPTTTTVATSTSTTVCTTTTTTVAPTMESNTDASVYSADCENNASEMTDEPSVESITTTTVAPSTSTSVSTTTTTVAPITSVKPTTPTTTTVVSTTSATPTTTDDPDFVQFQTYILSQMGPEDPKSQENAAAEAHKLITDSKYRNTIFHYIKSSSNSGTNVFDNPELFSF